MSEVIDVSIVVPIYNTDLAKLDRCIKSIHTVISNSRIRIECILVDDGSRNMIKEFIENNVTDMYSFRYFRKDNGGASSARNKGIELSRGDYILFVDADDALIPDSATKMLEYGVKSTADIIISDLIYEKGNKRSIWNAFRENTETIDQYDVLKALSQNGKLNGPVCKLLKRKYIIANQIRFPEKMITGEDAIFFYRVLEFEPTIKYYRHNTYVYYGDGSTSMNRMKNNGILILENYNTVFISYMKLLEVSSIHIDLIPILMVQNLEKHMKQISNYKLDLLDNRMLSNEIKQELKRTIEIIEQYEERVNYRTSKAYAIRKFVLKSNSILVCMAAMYLRKVYLFIKG